MNVEKGISNVHIKVSQSNLGTVVIIFISSF